MQTQRFMDIPKLLIEPEFLDLIPAASPDEKARLEKSILEDGCRDALVAWGDILLDGHKRKEICEKHGKEYQIIQKTFENRDQAKLWIIGNQLARRNLSPQQRTILIGTEYNLEKKKPGGDGSNQFTEQSGQNDHFAKTADLIAQRHGVSPRTVRRAGKAAEEFEKLPPEDRAAILASEKKYRKGGDGTRGQSTADMKNKNEHPEEDDRPSLRADSETLFKLKLLWDKATKADKRRFLKYIKKEGEKLNG